MVEHFILRFYFIELFQGPSFELVENAFQQLVQFKEETESAFRNFNSLKEENEKLRNQLNMANKQLKVTVGMLRIVKPYFKYGILD